MSTDFIAREIVKALLDLPGFVAGAEPHEVVNVETGERVRPSMDDPEGYDYGVVYVVGPDGSENQIPGHHYLYQAIARNASDPAAQRAVLDRLRASHDI